MATAMTSRRVMRERMATTFRGVRKSAEEHALAPRERACHGGALLPPPFVLRACP
jgi:hypothetical protein